MSNYLAIATVTSALRDLLYARIKLEVTGADVIMMRPDNAVHENGSNVNLSLYQVTPNAAWRNADVPTRRSDGSVLQRPMAALDLHYMISFYSKESDLITQVLLGSVVRTLQAEPQLTRERIRLIVPTTMVNGKAILAPSNLADQIELVKFSPLHLSLEEFAKIWSVFYQIPYALSVAYQASVVLIESDDTPTGTLPVRTRNIYALPFHQPVIEQITAQTAGAETIPITADSTLLIAGERLRGQVIQMPIAGVPTPVGALVRIGGIDVPIALADVSETEITLPLATAVGLQDGAEVPLSPALRAGVQGIQVLHQVPMGEILQRAGGAPDIPATPHRGVESNVAAFVLQPALTAPPQFAAGVVTLTVAPAIRRQQRVALLLNEIAAPPATPLALPKRPRTYSFALDPAAQTWLDQTGVVVIDPKNMSANDTAATITFAVPGVQPVPGGQPITYLVRIRVDGAESPLEVDAPSGRYIRPQVVIP